MTGIIKYEAFINISTALIAQGWTIFGFSNVNIHQTCQEKIPPSNCEPFLFFNDLSDIYVAIVGR